MNKYHLVDTCFNVSRNAVKGVAGEVDIYIKSFEYALEKTGGIPSMVELNGEGCEWAF